MLEIETELFTRAINGKMPKITFDFSHKLTEEVTLKLYKWITLSDIYEDLRILKSRNNNTKDIRTLREIEATRKKYLLALYYRKLLLNRFNIHTFPNEDYKLTIDRAYFTYFTNNPEFEKKVKELQNFIEILKKKVNNKEKIPEFGKDLLELEENELEDLYNWLHFKYIGPPSFSKEEKKKELKTLNKAEKVSSFIIEESSHSEVTDKGYLLTEGKEKPTKSAKQTIIKKDIPSKPPSKSLRKENKELKKLKKGNDATTEQ